MITIKQATKKDTKTIALLGRITFTESHGKFITTKEYLANYLNTSFAVDQIGKEISDTDNIFYVLEYENLPIGYAKLVLNMNTRKIKEKEFCRLERIYILNDFLPLKLGQSLLDKLLLTAKQNKQKHIWLSVYDKNLRAMQFYLKNGFYKSDILKFKIGAKEYDNDILIKAL